MPPKLINVELPLEQWNQALTSLAEDKFKNVAGLIMQIREQVMSQVSGPGNGAAALEGTSANVQN